MSVVDAIENVIHRETQAWDEGDVDLLFGIFHPELVWIWPPTGFVGDLLGSKLQVSRFDPDHWRAGWSSIFSNELLRNERQIRKVTPSPRGDAAVAVVEVAASWRTAQGAAGWSGLATKCYVRVGGGWKMITHIGL